ncbi:MAG: hypothetical protein ACRDJ9_29665, partial [Dehalococcoidia bacterium]
GYRITFPQEYRLADKLIQPQGDFIGRDVYTLLTRAEERALCETDPGHIGSPTRGAELLVEVHRAGSASSPAEWASTSPHGTHRTAEALTVNGLPAARLVRLGEVEAYVIAANSRMYVIYPTSNQTEHPLDLIAQSFHASVPQPLPSPTADPRQAASDLAARLASAFAARDADAVARLMTDCWMQTSVVLDGEVVGMGPVTRPVSRFLQLLRQRFAAGELTVTVDPAVQHDSRDGLYYVVSQWRYPDRTTRIDLYLSDRRSYLDERPPGWIWVRSRHHFTRADQGYPFRSPWAEP